MLHATEVMDLTSWAKAPIRMASELFYHHVSVHPMNPTPRILCPGSFLPLVWTIDLEVEKVDLPNH